MCCCLQPVLFPRNNSLGSLPVTSRDEAQASSGENIKVADMYQRTAKSTAKLGDACPKAICLINVARSEAVQIRMHANTL